MKTKMVLVTLAAVGISLASCDKDDDGIKVNQVIETAFRNQYPDAGRVEWEMKSGYYVADFRQNGLEAEAWYSGQGVWHMTETDVQYADMPQGVKDAFAGSEYASWRIDDIDKLECVDRETVYIIEVEQGNTEYDLYYSPEGIFIKAVQDKEGSGHIPENVMPAVKEYISQNYPQARIADIEQEHGLIEVDIIDGSTPREVVFTQEGTWSYTKTEVRKSNVPLVVMNALTASDYGTWHIDDIDHYLTVTVEYYLFEVESGNREVELKIDTEGNILQ